MVWLTTHVGAFSYRRAQGGLPSDAPKLGENARILLEGITIHSTNSYHSEVLTSVAPPSQRGYCFIGGCQYVEAAAIIAEWLTAIATGCIALAAWVQLPLIFWSGECSSRAN